jgi:hypothetical protein
MTAHEPPSLFHPALRPQLEAFVGQVLGLAAPHLRPGGPTYAALLERAHGVLWPGLAGGAAGPAVTQDTAAAAAAAARAKALQDALRSGKLPTCTGVFKTTKKPCTRKCACLERMLCKAHLEEAAAVPAAGAAAPAAAAAPAPAPAPAREEHTLKRLEYVHLDDGQAFWLDGDTLELYAVGDAGRASCLGVLNPKADGWF